MCTVDKGMLRPQNTGRTVEYHYFKSVFSDSMRCVDVYLFLAPVAA